MSSHFSATPTSGPTPDEVRAYQQALAAFRRRKTWALAVSIAAYVAAIVLIALGAALVLGSLNTIGGDYLADRHAPGADGSISLPSDGDYAITRGDEPAPQCVVTDAAGAELALRQQPAPRDANQQLVVFTAQRGSYTVTCAGGQLGVVVFSMAQIDVVTSGWLGLTLRALPFLVVGMACYVVGRVVPRRIAPESMRPVIPR